MKNKFFGILAASAFLAAAPLSAHAAPVTYALDTTHTTVIWKVEHLGFSYPHGLFSNIEGTLVLDEADIAKSTVDATIPITKGVTGIPKLDEHLMGKDFFNTEKFPTAKFVSTKVEKTGDKTAKVTGDLTLAGVTKPVTLDVTFIHKGQHPMMKKEAVGFSATTTIKRSDFGISYGLPNVADEVGIEIQSEAQVAAHENE